MEYKRFTALKNSIEPCQKQLEPFREELAAVLKAYTGPHYGKNTGDDRPVNMLQLSVESLLQQLSSRAPQVLCLTHKPELKSSAVELELAMNEALKRMKFEQEHRLWVLSAIFLVGVMEVGLDIVDSPEVDGEVLPMTEIFCEAIMFDDFVFDTTAAKWDRRQVSFWGHKYRVPLAEAKKNKNFNKEAREALKPVENNSADDTSKISKPDGDGTNDPFTNMCEIWQIFVPEENEVITFSCDGGDMPLRTVEWHGPKHGPYHFFGFNPVLNNIMPLPPVANWVDLDDLLNKLYVKLGNQASRQKTIGIVDNQGSSIADAQGIIKTVDGDVLPVGNPNAFREASFGGVNQQTLGFALNVKGMADFVMGNLSAQMGLGSSAGTLGQEQLIKQAANVRISSMQGVLLTATKAVLNDIMFYLHYHPTAEYDLTLDITGANIKLPIKWPRRDDGYGQEIDVRKGEPEDYPIDIEPFSMIDVSPGQRAELLRAIWREDILPAVQLGVQPDFGVYLDKLAKYYDLPELREIVKTSQESMDPQERLAGGGGMPQAGKPNGEYTRNNVSRGMTPQAADQQMAQMLMSGGGEGDGS